MKRRRNKTKEINNGTKGEENTNKTKMLMVKGNRRNIKTNYKRINT